MSLWVREMPDSMVSGNLTGRFGKVGVNDGTWCPNETLDIPFVEVNPATGRSGDSARPPFPVQDMRSSASLVCLRRRRCHLVPAVRYVVISFDDRSGEE